MQYTKTMIDLIFQIRKTTPAPVRARVKLTSPTLLETLIDIHRMVDDAELKVLIYELLTHAGPQWAKAVALPAVPLPKRKTPAQPQADAAPAPPTTTKAKEKVVMYRGQRMVVPA